ncbi:MAG: phosphate ABC transporter permease subunit PstC [Melioribacteraceae bacterium]|nr:MAG: phosphate ABC transporter permease subunit PstC [Melioribacteraceae bacterium]
MSSSNSPYKKLVSKRIEIKESLIRFFFMINGYVAVLFLLLIFIFLLQEAFSVIIEPGVEDFVYSERTDASGESSKVYEWYPTSDDPRYSLVPLIMGSLLTALPATIIATFFGIILGIYLAEIASNRLREILKPAVELFAGIPTVVMGFFIIAVGATLFQDFFGFLNRLNAFVASLGLSLIIIPIIASLSEEAMRSVPIQRRMASYALGATKWQTIIKVVIPSALSGISAGIILGFGRAIGETMIVLMATGNAAELTFDIFRSVRTMTATIAAEMGEVSQQSSHYYALFFIGVVLFVVTFLLNLIAALVLRRMNKKAGNYS